jgi:hypothetical protein
MRPALATVSRSLWRLGLQALWLKARAKPINTLA